MEATTTNTEHTAAGNQMVCAAGGEWQRDAR